MVLGIKRHIIVNSRKDRKNILSAYFLCCLKAVALYIGYIIKTLKITPHQKVSNT